MELLLHYLNNEPQNQEKKSDLLVVCCTPQKFAEYLFPDSIISRHEWFNLLRFHRESKLNAKIEEIIVEAPLFSNLDQLAVFLDGETQSKSAWITQISGLLQHVLRHTLSEIFFCNTTSSFSPNPASLARKLHQLTALFSFSTTASISHCSSSHSLLCVTSSMCCELIDHDCLQIAAKLNEIFQFYESTEKNLAIIDSLRAQMFEFVCHALIFVAANQRDLQQHTLSDDISVSVWLSQSSPDQSPSSSRENLKYLSRILRTLAECVMSQNMKSSSSICKHGCDWTTQKIGGLITAFNAFGILSCTASQFFCFSSCCNQTENEANRIHKKLAVICLIELLHNRVERGGDDEEAAITRNLIQRFLLDDNVIKSKTSDVIEREKKEERETEQICFILFEVMRIEEHRQSSSNCWQKISDWLFSNECPTNQQFARIETKFYTEILRLPGMITFIAQHPPILKRIICKLQSTKNAHQSPLFQLFMSCLMAAEGAAQSSKAVLLRDIIACQNSSMTLPHSRRSLSPQNVTQLRGILNRMTSHFSASLHTQLEALLLLVSVDTKEEDDTGEGASYAIIREMLCTALSQSVACQTGIVQSLACIIRTTTPTITSNTDENDDATGAPVLIAEATLDLAANAFHAHKQAELSVQQIKEEEETLNKWSAFWNALFNALQSDCSLKGVAIGFGCGMLRNLQDRLTSVVDDVEIKTNNASRSSKFTSPTGCVITSCIIMSAVMPTLCEHKSETELRKISRKLVAQLFMVIFANFCCLRNQLDDNHVEVELSDPMKSLFAKTLISAALSEQERCVICTSLPHPVQILLAADFLMLTGNADDDDVIAFDWSAEFARLVKKLTSQSGTTNEEVKRAQNLSLLKKTFWISIFRARICSNWLIQQEEDTKHQLENHRCIAPTTIGVALVEIFWELCQLFPSAILSADKLFISALQLANYQIRMGNKKDGKARVRQEFLAVLASVDEIILERLKVAAQSLTSFSFVSLYHNNIF